MSLSTTIDGGFSDPYLMTVKPAWHWFTPPSPTRSTKRVTDESPVGRRRHENRDGSQFGIGAP